MFYVDCATQTAKGQQFQIQEMMFLKILPQWRLTGFDN
jgi:hypothetical protein